MTMCAQTAAYYRLIEVFRATWCVDITFRFDSAISSAIAMIFGEMNFMETTGSADAGTSVPPRMALVFFCRLSILVGRR